MKAYRLQFTVQVNGSKYREFLNLMQKEIDKPKLKGCNMRKLSQSVSNMNEFNYTEEWTDLSLLRGNLATPEFGTIKGAVKVLCDSWTYKVFECSDIDELSLLMK